jgi:hypothetical protein
VGGLKETFEELRPKLLAFRDERGRELFDLPRARRPPAETPAPVRFLPDYDNLLLGHADRTRVIADAHRARVATANLRVLSTFLVDGVVGGTWRIERGRSSAVLVLEPFATLARFVESDAHSAEVRFG